MIICERCNVGGEKIRLFDVIYNGKIMLLCERCSIIENVPVIKSPDYKMLRDSERKNKVYDRMRILAGIKSQKKEETFFIEDRLKELDKNPSLELPEEYKLNMIQNFHWEIMKNRRRKGLSHEKLAEILGESPAIIEMLEKGKLPENSENIIKKLEQFFQIRLRRYSELDRLLMEKAEMQKPILLDERGNPLEIIPEEEIELLEAELDVANKETRENNEKILEKEIIEEKKDLDLKKANLSGVTIGDLRKIHRKKIEVTRKEQIEEQRKIEERKSILEAMRERERLKIEERKQRELKEKQRLEEEKQKILNEKNQELLKKREKELKELDKFLGGSELLNNKDDKFFDDL